MGVNTVVQERRIVLGILGQGVCAGKNDVREGTSICQSRREFVTDWMMRLADRLRMVRVCCGDWQRVCDSPTTMDLLGTTAVFLDPPYRVKIAGREGDSRTRHIYANDKVQDIDALCDRVRDWCLKWAPNKDVRIALCGYEGEYPEIESLVGAGGWSVMEWSSAGGYGNRSREGKNENRHRERVWFSPHCVPEHKEATLWA